MKGETLDDIVEELADELGIYGAHAEEHPDGQCECRVCWTTQITTRIKDAIQNDIKVSIFDKWDGLMRKLAEHD